MRALKQWQILCGGGLLLSAGFCEAQFGRGDSTWTTAGADAQRSSWVRSDAKISKEGVQKPEFRLLWKLKLADKPGVTSITPAVLLAKYIGYRGFRDLALVESNDDSIYALDVDLGRVEWNVHLKPAAGGSASCGSGMTAGLARPAATAFAGAGTSFGPGRGIAAKSGVGEPGEGAVTLTQAAAYGFRPPTPRPAVTPTAGAATAPTPRLGRGPITFDVLGGDGMLHTAFVSNGQDAQPAAEFVPANSAVRGFFAGGDAAYATIQGCGTAGGGVKMLDLTTKQVTGWDASSPIAGSAGAAFGPDGTLYAATVSGDLVALDGKTLAVKDTYTAKGEFITSPVVFEYRQRVLAVAATKDGSLHLVDTKSLGGEDHQTPLFKTSPGSASFVPGALASFQDTGGRRWILAPVSASRAEASFKTNGAVTKGAIAAWQVDEQSGTVVLTPGWISPDIAAPSTPMIVNGVVFAASNASPAVGGNATEGSAPAVIYALDSASGKELWNSGKAMSASAHHGSLSAGGSQIYLGADDGTFYAFGAWIERQ